MGGEAGASAGAFSARLERDPAIDAECLALCYDGAGDPRRRLEVAIAPRYGSNMYRLRAGEDDLIVGDPALLRERDWTGTFVLWPIPNRVRDKAFEFEGRRYSLREIRRPRGNDVLIHGLVDDLAWEHDAPVADRQSASAETRIAIAPGTRLYQFFPFACALTLRYVLTAEAIRIEYSVENCDTKDLPFGFALHPYFATLGGPERTYVTLPADAVMEADAELLPSGRLIDVGGTPFDLRRPRPVAALHLDHVFTALHTGEPAAIDYRTRGLRLHLRASADCTHLVLYTLESASGFICLENQTGSTDMINLHARARRSGDAALERAAHLLVLPPGGRHKGFIEYRLIRGGA